jgi:hypothetical protein
MTHSVDRPTYFLSRITIRRTDAPGKKTVTMGWQVPL